MSISKADLTNHIITPTLKEFEIWSDDALDLILATCAQESQFGKFLVQQGGGPALGIWQMEPNSYNDLIDNVIYSSKQDFKSKIEAYFGFSPLKIYVSKLIYDLRYACLLCRLQYWRYSEPIPKAGDIDGQFSYWKRYYNRNNQTGSRNQFIMNYNQYVKYG